MRKYHLLPMSFLCMALVGVVSCGRQSAPETSTSVASDAATNLSQEQADLKIVGYGPEGTEAGKAFNAQASGEAALWVKLNHPVGGPEAAIWWGDHRLKSAVNGSVVSAVVPSSFYADAGRYPLQVRAGGDSPADKSSIVYFVVK